MSKHSSSEAKTAQLAQCLQSAHILASPEAILGCSSRGSRMSFSGSTERVQLEASDVIVVLWFMSESACHKWVLFWQVCGEPPVATLARGVVARVDGGAGGDRAVIGSAYSRGSCRSVMVID
ncbi:hypothetical protein BaRGS_00002599 [Batillaria attramentaria]|uniref:Uncharacterized protein n=1 Tax=Batillaria attramentaria TaxID=370345 RepID=A0ABD0M5C6_9CAEN